MKFIIILLFCSKINYAKNDSIYKIENRYLKNIVLKSMTERKSFLNDSKNLGKISFPLLNQPAISFQYERNIYKKISAGLSLGYVLEQDFLILKMVTERRIPNEFAKNQINNIKTKIFSISPEVKIYFGKDVFKGFYVAPFIRFSNYDVHFPLDYLEESLDNYYQKVIFSGKFTTTTFGLSIGAQWEIYKNFYLDWLIIGPHFGNAKERLILESDLSLRQQKGINKSLEIIQKVLDTTDGIPDVNFDYEVNENGGIITLRNPWAGMRFQLGIGYRF